MITPEPVLAIVIPCHNISGKCAPLMKCLEGLHTPKVEVVFVNDASTDDTLSILQRAQTQLKVPTRLYSGNFFGPGGARNAGVKATSAKYLWFVDADDRIDYEPVLSRMEELEKGELDVMSFLVKEYERPYISGCRVGPAGAFDTYAGFGRVVGKLIHRRVLIDNNIYYPERVMAGEDSAFALFVSYYAMKRKSYDEFIYEVIPAQNSITRGKFTPQYLTRWRVAKPLVTFINDKITGVDRDKYLEHVVSLTLTLTWSYYLEHRRYLSLLARLPYMLSAIQELGLRAYLGKFLQTGSSRNRLLKRVAVQLLMPASRLFDGSKLLSQHERPTP